MAARGVLQASDVHTHRLSHVDARDGALFFFSILRNFEFDLDAPPPRPTAMRASLSCCCCCLLAVASAFTPPTSLLPLHARVPTAANLRLSASEPLEDEAEVSPVLDALPKVAGAGLALSTLLHAPTFASFAAQWQAIGAAGVTGDDFWAPLKFWILFAVAHPLLQPAIWIGEVLHSSPGPQIADVMPITFILGNVAVIGALSTFAELRTALNLALLALFIHYVGCGLEGSKVCRRPPPPTPIYRSHPIGLLILDLRSTAATTTIFSI